MEAVASAEPDVGCGLGWAGLGWTGRVVTPVRPAPLPPPA